MMLLLLILITLLSLVFNMAAHEKDIMHPSCIFSLVFLVSEIVCLLNVRQYEILFHWQTVMAVTMGLLAFSAAGVFFGRLHSSGSVKKVYPVKKIEISNTLVIILILFYMITIFSFLKYLDEITEIYNAQYYYNGLVYSLAGKIKLYDTLTKFWTATFAKMNVPVPLLYRIGNPVCYSCAMIMIYIIVNNYAADRSVNPLHLAAVLLLVIHIVINGSRSPLFRILTMFLILFYIFRYGSSDRTDSFEFIRQRQKKRFYAIAFVTLSIAAIGFMGILLVMGRMDSSGFDPLKYLFIYIGAPLVNLDNYIASHAISFRGGLIGAQTFSALYNYIAKLTGLSGFSVTGVGGFAFSNNGIEIGNVYTTFFAILYDFGFGGVIPLIGLIAVYYCFTYENVKRHRWNDDICFRLFIYSYLFNDLIMLIFSNRFYATVCDPVFIKLLIVSAGAELILFRRTLKIGRYRLQKETFTQWLEKYRFLKIARNK